MGIHEYPRLEADRADGRVTRGQVFPAVGSDAIRWPRSGWWWPGMKAGVCGNAMFPGAWGGPGQQFFYSLFLGNSSSILTNLCHCNWVATSVIALITSC